MSNDIFLYDVPAFTDRNDIKLRILTSAQVVGGFTGRKVKKAELDRALKEQRDETFSRRRFEELKAAEEAAALKAQKAKSAKEKAALKKAAEAAAEVVEEVKEREFVPDYEIERLTMALQAASEASKSSVAIREAGLAARAAQAVLDQIADDDEEETLIMMLL